MRAFLPLVALCSLVAVSDAQRGRSPSSNTARTFEITRERAAATSQKTRRARHLMTLGQSLDEAEALLFDARSTTLRGGYEDELLAELYEMQGRLEKARLTYRSVVILPDGQQSSSALSPVHLMRYALLSQKTGSHSEETLALSRIEGNTTWDKLLLAAEMAEHENARLAVDFWTEASRLRPKDAKVIARLSAARQAYEFLQEARIADAKKALTAKNPS